MRRTSCVLERKAALMHLVLLDVSTGKMVHTARLVHLHLELRWVERPLLADKDVEVVIGSVHAGVALGAQGCAEDDEVLGDAGVDDVHATHGTAGIVEHPLGRVGVDGNDAWGVLSREIGDDVGNDGVDVIRVFVYGCLCQLMEVFGREDIPPVLRKH